MVSCGIPSLDEVIQGLRLGDNVVWQVDEPDNYLRVVHPFMNRAVEDGRTVVHIRFAPHPTVLPPSLPVADEEVDPRYGFDFFSAQVNQIIEERGRGVFYIFDNLSSLVADWATDELLANFFQVTCPYLHELDTIAYFALTRGQHAHTAARTTSGATSTSTPSRSGTGTRPKCFCPTATTTGSCMPSSKADKPRPFL